MKLNKYACIVAALGFAVGHGAIGCSPAEDDDGSGGSGGKGGSKSGGSGGAKSGGSGGAKSGGSGGTKSGGSGGSKSGGSTGTGGTGTGGSMGGSGGDPGPAGGLIGYWNFDGNTMDSSGKGNHGTAVKGNREDSPAVTAKFAEGKKGMALDLSANPALDVAGVTEWEWVKVPSSDSINETGLSGKFSISAWVKVDKFDETADDFNFIISRHELGTAQEHFGLGLLAGAPSCAVHFFFATAPNALTVGQWHHVAATYDTIDQAVYVDGALGASASIGWPIAADSTHTVIGGNQNIENVKEGFSGFIDELRLYSESLTAAQITAEMAK